MEPIELYFTKEQYKQYGGYIKKNVFKDMFNLKWWYGRQQWSKPKVAVVEYQKNNDGSRLLTITSASNEFVDVIDKLVKHIGLEAAPLSSALYESIPLSQLIKDTVTREIEMNPNIEPSVIVYMVAHRLRDANPSALLRDE